MAKVHYPIVIEQGEDEGFWAYVPDLPGCISAGDSAEEVYQNVQEAIALYTECLIEQGQPVPEPNSVSILQQVA